MKHRRPVRPWPLAAVLVAFCAGVVVDSVLRTFGPPLPVDAPMLIGPTDGLVQPKPDTTGTGEPKPDTTADRPVVPGFSRATGGPTSTVGTTSLRLPIDGMNLELVKGSFYEPRGSHRHEAIDILAPRHTPIRAVQSGTIAKLFASRAGGITLYQFDPSGRLCYYYAHLERYAPNVREGDTLSEGQIVGYVGTSGNAPPSTPHLHFAIFELGQDRKWWQGRPVDPYEFFIDRTRE